MFSFNFDKLSGNIALDIDSLLIPYLSFYTTFQMDVGFSHFILHIFQYSFIVMGNFMCQLSYTKVPSGFVKKQSRCCCEVIFICD